MKGTPSVFALAGVLLGTAAPALAAPSTPAVVAFADDDGDDAKQERRIVVRANCDDEDDEDCKVKVYRNIMGGAILGIEVTELNASLREHFGAPADAGVLVAGLKEDMPAARAGLKVGDVIIAVDDTDVTSTWSIREALSDRKAGDEVELRIIRDGRPLTLTSEVAEGRRERVDVGPMIFKMGDFHGLEQLEDLKGIDFKALEGLREHFNSPEWRAQVINLKDLDGDLQKRIQELESRLKELEKRLAASERGSR